MAEEDITLTTDIYGPGSFITYAGQSKVPSLLPPLRRKHFFLSFC